ncbi:unnamed protein product [Rhizopus microsporus]
MSRRERHDHNDDEKRHKQSKHSSSSKVTIDPIDEDDYYEKSAEFRLWLREHKDVYFTDLSSKEARRYFKKFVKRWNRHELEDKYYKGMNSSQLESSDTTNYKWSFAEKLDKFEMDSVRDSVDSMTGQSRGEDRMSRGQRRNVGPSLPDAFEKEEEYERKQAERKYEAKKRKERREMMLDEVAPREVGREAQLLKKRALNAYHKRERSPDVELSEADLMGGDDFQAMLAAERRRKEQREARRAEKRAPILNKMEEYKAKESATMEMFKKMAEEQRRRGNF